MNRKRKSLRSPLPASILPGDATRQEALRLLLQAAVYDPLTRRFLSDAGLQRGMRVLEVGSGPGSMSLLVSELVGRKGMVVGVERSEEHTSELQSRRDLVCRLLLEKKKKRTNTS